MGAVVEGSIANARVFVCYSHEDEDRVYPTVEWLIAQRIDLWYDQGIQAGADWPNAIAEALERATHVLYFISAASLRSAHCDREVQYAIDHHKTLVPVFLDEVQLTPSLRIALGRVQALHATGLAADVLRSKLYGAITDVQPSAPSAPQPRGGRLRRRTFYYSLGVVLIVMAGALAWWGFGREPNRPPTVADASVAVLPLIALSDDSALHHLGEAFAEGVSNKLTARADLNVVSRLSASKRRNEVDAPAIARALNVSYVVVGSLHPASDHVRLTAQLVRARDGFHVWSDVYDVATASHASFDDVVEIVSLMLSAKLDEDIDLQVARAGTENDEAYRHYAEARRLRNLSNTGGSTAPGEQILDEVDSALALDADFIPALTLRANLYFNRFVPVSWAVAQREARKSIDRALTLDPRDPMSVSSLASIQIQLELDFHAADQTLERLRAIDPRFRYLNQTRGHLAMVRGRSREAVQYWKRSIQQNPYNLNDHWGYGQVLLRLGELDGAETEFAAMARLAPKGFQHVLAETLRSQVSLLRGDVDGAKTRFDAIWAEYKYTYPELLAPILALLGRAPEARALVAELSENPNVDPYWVFRTYYALRDFDEALRWLRRAIDYRSRLVLREIRLPNPYPGLQELPEYADAIAYLNTLQRSG